MAKLIGHIFNPAAGHIFTAFEVDGLKETGRQYKKIKGETTDGTPPYSYEYWNIMPKAELGELRQPGYTSFTMYATAEDMPRFKELVIARLEKRVETEKKKYQTAVHLLNAATGADIIPSCPLRHWGACLPGNCKHNQPDGGGGEAE